MPMTMEQTEYLSQLLQGLEPVSKELNPNSRNFVADQVKRFDQYGANMFLSPKQLKWLEDLHQEFVGELPEAGAKQEEPPDQESDAIDDKIPF